MLAAIVGAGAAQAQEGPQEWLVLGSVSRGGREALAADPVLERLYGSAEPAWPKVGEKLGNRTWTAVKAGEGGKVRSGLLAGGTAYARITSDRDRIVIVDAKGISGFSVNLDPFAGDPYAYGWVRIPVFLRKGENHVVVRGRFEEFAWQVEEPAAPLMIVPGDATLPDMIEGEKLESLGAVTLLNATAQAIGRAVLTAGDQQVDVPAIPPLGLLKVPIRIRSGPELALRVSSAGGVHESKVTLRVRKKGQSYKRTFVSAMDGSVQYYSVYPPVDVKPDRTYALVLTLHGAAVEATNQTDAYTPKEWCYIVAPTNRRPYGFDWEEFGRLDGLEVLDHATKSFRIDPSRVYLTGHSMGGHGTWHFAVNHPDRWAVAAPSAGWISFWSYGGSRDAGGKLGGLFRRGMSASDTMGLLPNLKELPLFIIHGDADDNVPATESRKMVEELGKFHRNYRYHEEKGAKHWWGRPDTPGAACVNLHDLFDFFQRHRRPERPEQFNFTTMSAGVSSRCWWMEVLFQPDQHAMSRVDVRRDGVKHVVKTVNVGHLGISVDGTFEVDGTAFEAMKAPFELVKDGAAWKSGRPEGLRKRPELYGPFKQAFQRPFLLVAPTQGADDEARAALAKARYDGQLWWYRGNGLGRVVTDRDVTGEMAKSFNLILYGSEESNACWKAIAGKTPVSVRPGRCAVADSVIEDDVALAALYPSPHDPARFVAFIGATGPGGRRAWRMLDWSFSGVAWPDVAVWDASVFSKGMDAVRLAGYFGGDWKPDEKLWVVRREY